MTHRWLYAVMHVSWEVGYFHTHSLSSAPRSLPLPRRPQSFPENLVPMWHQWLSNTRLQTGLRIERNYSKYNLWTPHAKVMTLQSSLAEVWLRETGFSWCSSRHFPPPVFYPCLWNGEVISQLHPQPPALLPLLLLRPFLELPLLPLRPFLALLVHELRARAAGGRPSVDALCDKALKRRSQNSPCFIQSADTTHCYKDYGYTGHGLLTAY